jgi:hypothetical protein
MEGLMPIHIRYGDKNGVLSQRLDTSPVAPTVMLYLQAPYTAIVTVFGVFMRIDINTNVRQANTMTMGKFRRL